MENKNTEKIWYALYTKSRAEKKILEQFTRMNIQAYLPLKKELRQWSDRKKWVETPIINSYIFINIPLSDYYRVFDVPGVVAYISHKGKAIAIPEEQIEAMQRTVENKLNFSIETQNIKKGQMVKVATGPLKGVVGKVLEIRGERKLYIEISKIGYTLVVSLDDDILVE